MQGCGGEFYNRNNQVKGVLALGDILCFAKHWKSETSKERNITRVI